MRKHLLLVLCVLAMTAAQTSRASNYSVARRAVCHYFTGYHCVEAMAVVGCETGRTYSPWAKNGQYLGIFQMGLHERAKFGHGNNVWAQSRAAHRYYRYELVHGLWGWTPWSCKSVL